MTMGNVTVVVSDITGPSKTDRNLIVVLYLKNWGRGSTSIAYRQPLKLAEGATTAQLEIPFTTSQSQLVWDVGVFEEGRDIEDTRNRKRNPNQQDYHWAYNLAQNGNYLPIAGLQASTVDSNQQSENSKIINTYVQTQLQRTGGGTQQMGVQGTVINPGILTSVTQASSDWRNYLPYPVSIASVDAIQEVNDSQPQVAEALRSYVSAGGLLSVYDAQSPESIDTVNRLLRIPSPETAASWRICNEASFLTFGIGEGDAKTNVTFDGNLTTQKVIVRQYARGTVLVANLSLGELLESQGAEFQTYNSARSLGTLTSTTNDGNWFWQNLILTVGKPPVLVFCIIVAIFGALLGPGLLYFTGRMQRRSLMIFLVPAVSSLATLAIVLYGALHEGFENYVRLHSVTVYDAPSQVAFGWSRQNYFSGLPPREGLQFPVDSYVRPVYSEDESNYGGDPNPRSGLSGTVNIDTSQTWNDWLKPRQHQQLLVGHRVEPDTIPIATEKNASGGLVLTNLTEFQLPFVAVRGKEDDYYITTDLGPKKSIELLPQDRDSMAVIVGRVGADFKPIVPPELAGGGDSLMNFGNSRRYARTYSTQADIIGEAFKIFLTDEIELPPYSFAALVPQSNAIAVPLEGIQADNVNLAIGVEPW